MRTEAFNSHLQGSGIVATECTNGSAGVDIDAFASQVGAKGELLSSATGAREKLHLC
jgi:hypothetical protein